MVILFYLLALCVVAAASTAGWVYLLLRSTKFARFIVEVSIGLFPAWLVVTGSLGGYLPARSYCAAWTAVVVAVGTVLTAWLAFRNKARLGEGLRRNGGRVAAVVSAAVLAGMIAVPRQVAENSLGYFEFMNGEFINYSQMAAFAVGQQHSSLPVAWAVYSQASRDATDFLAGSLAVFSGNEPVNVVQLLSAFFRTSYLCLCFLAVWEMRARDFFGAVLAVLLIAAWSVYNLDILNFSISYMGANSVMATVVVLVLLLFFSEDLPISAFIVIYTIGTLYMMQGYPEAMPFIIIVEAGVALPRAVLRHDWSLGGRLLAANALSVAVNPPAAFHKVAFVRDVVHSHCGWNVICSPVDDTAVYLLHLLGWKSAYVPGAVASPVLVLAAFLIFSALALWALSAAAKKLDCAAVWLIPAGAAWFHLAPLVATDPLDYRQFYGGLKFFLLWLWVIPIAVGLAASCSRRSVVFLFLAATALFTVGNGASLWRATRVKLKIPAFYSKKLTEEVIRTVKGTHRLPVILTEEGVPLKFWFEVLDSAGIEPLMLSASQAQTIARDPGAAWTDPLPAGGGKGLEVVAIEPLRYLWMANRDYDIQVTNESPANFFSHPQDIIQVEVEQSIWRDSRVVLEKMVLKRTGEAAASGRGGTASRE
jgi:hypothetical protein